MNGENERNGKRLAPIITSDLMSFTVTPLPFLHSLPAGGRSREPALRYGMRDEGPTEVAKRRDRLPLTSLSLRSRAVRRLRREGQGERSEPVPNDGGNERWEAGPVHEERCEGKRNGPNLCFHVSPRPSTVRLVGSSVHTVHLLTSSPSADERSEKRRR